MTRCPDCGRPLTLKGRFCKACGWDAELDGSEEGYLDGVDLPGEGWDDAAYREVLADEGLAPARPWDRRRVVIVIGAIAALIAMALLVVR